MADAAGEDGPQNHGASMQFGTQMRCLTQTTLIAALVVTSALAAGCNEQSITALRPGFDISWPAEFGFDQDDLSVSAMVFGQVTTGTVSNFEVVISNPGRADLEVEAIYLAIAQFDENGDLANEMVVENHAELSTNAVPGNLPDGTVYMFEMRFTPLYGVALESDLHLVVRHELNSNDPLYIPILGEGFGEPQPDIYSKPTFIDFGVLGIGDTSPNGDVAVGNAGPGLLTNATVTLDDEVNFSLDVGSTVGDFALGDVGFLTALFHPQSQGEHTGTITIVSNDPDENPYSIQLTGVGDPPALGKAPIAACEVTADNQTGQAIQILHACPSGNCPTAVWDGSGSSDPMNLPLTFSWTLSPPTGSASSMSSNSSMTPSALLDVAGTYSGTLIVTNSNGQASAPCTATVEAIPNENFRVELSWQNSGDDMDLHLLRAQPAGAPRTDGDCYYANCQTGGWGGTTPDWGVAGVADDDPALDLDDIPGVGPENINIPQPAGSPYDGWYEVFVHDYPGSVFQAANDVTVNIYLNGILQQPTYTFAMSGEDDDYYVAKIEWPSGNIVPCNGLAGCP